MRSRRGSVEARERALAASSSQRLNTEERLRLLVTHAEGLRRYILRFVQGADAEDLLQDLRVLVLRHPSGPASGHQFLAWCKGVLRNLAAHHFRNRRRRDRLHAAARSELEASTEAMLNPEQQAAIQQVLGQIWSSLDSEERTLLVERFLLDATHQEIAARHQRSAASLRMWLARLRALLRGRARQK